MRACPAAIAQLRWWASCTMLFDMSSNTKTKLQGFEWQREGMPRKIKLLPEAAGHLPQAPGCKMAT